jgi:hypothetical protein
MCHTWKKFFKFFVDYFFRINTLEENILLLQVRFTAMQSYLLTAFLIWKKVLVMSDIPVWVSVLFHCVTSAGYFKGFRNY